jgi:putative transcriptional regulator
MQLRELREQCSKSREELAVAVGVTYSTIANLETGRFKPRIDLALKIAEYFGVSVEDIEWGASTEPSASDDAETSGKDARAAVA